NSSDSSTSRGSAPQWIGTNGRSARAERSWMARATSSLPVPLSPSTSTDESVGATRSTTRSTSCMRGLWVWMPLKGAAPGARARAVRAAGSRHRRPARGARGSFMPPLWVRSLLELRRHHDAEHAALAGPALDLDPAAVVGHDALRDGETEAGALSRRLGREERIEDPAEDLLVHARSLVLELHLDLVADVARPDGEATAPVHRLQPVRGDAEEH